MELPNELCRQVHLLPSCRICTLSPYQILKVVLLLEHISDDLSSVSLAELVCFAAVLEVHLNLIVLVEVVVKPITRFVLSEMIVSV
jgi:hypothetical protein